MKDESKNKWMVWAIVVLAIMNISTLLTILYHRNNAETELVTSSDPIELESSSIGYSGRYFRDQLNLNRYQMNRFVEFNPVFRQQARSININLERLRHQMLLEMAGSGDTGKLNLLSDSIGYLHSGLKKLTYRYYLDIKNICDPEQQKKLEQIFQQIFKGEVQMGHYGKGGPNGRRYGRQNNLN